MPDKKEQLESIKHQLFELTKQYVDIAFAPQEFHPNINAVPVSGKVFNHTEIQYLLDASLDGWFTTGRYNDEFEKQLAKYIGVRKLLTVNSGSSANLLAFATLTAHELGERAIKPMDEVITVAASFPTTVNPLILYGAVPVFVDVDIPTYNIQIEKIEQAITTKTKAIMVAHTLGNPFDAEAIAAIARKHNLWFIEDCCDALGATINGKHVGTFSDLATLSFYPAHHITTGEGGAVFTNNAKLIKITESFRDWGRDCWCASGCDNTCAKRFEWQLGDLPYGYDHKYIYSRIGYNLKITDMQAALGLAQLQKLPEFIAKRKHNFNLLLKGLEPLQHKLILPQATPNTNPSWFGFLITIKPHAGITRNQLIQKLTERKIATRLLFSGDLRKQPYFKGIPHRSVGTFENTETILHHTFWVGVTPMITDEMVAYMIESFHEIMNENAG